MDVRCRLATTLSIALTGVAACGDAFEDPVETEVGEAEICDRVRTWESDWVAWEADMLRELDAARAQKLSCDGAVQKRQRALFLIPELTCAARLQAQELAELGELSHAGPGGDYVGRLDVSGYEGVPTAELLAIDVELPEKAVARWVEDPEACSALLGPSDEAEQSRAYADEVGVALYRDDRDQIAHWVVALGQRRD